MKLLDVAYHRNGICGNGFYAAIFTEPDDRSGAGGKDRKMLAIHFPAPTDKNGKPLNNEVNTAVFDLDLLKQDNIAFGENSWRGDHYHDWLKDACPKEHDRQFNAILETWKADRETAKAITAQARGEV